MYMGIIKMPELRSYWSRNIFFKNAFVPNHFSRNRFELILRCLHFADNSKEMFVDSNVGAAENTNDVSDIQASVGVTDDRLYKIRSLSDLLIQKFTNVYKPGPVLTVDESLIPFKGRLIFRQYMKSKTHRYGIKMFKLCSGSGYTDNLTIYLGKMKDKR